MADVFLYKNVEKVLAKHEMVQDYMDELLFEMKAKASAELVRHKQDGHAKIETAQGRIDHYLILSDEYGEKAALSIEFGRAGYIDPDTGELWGAMDGLYILRNATGIPKKRMKVKREVRRRPGRNGKGQFTKVKPSKRKRGS